MTIPTPGWPSLHLPDLVPFLPFSRFLQLKTLFNRVTEAAQGHFLSEGLKLSKKPILDALGSPLAVRKGWIDRSEHSCHFGTLRGKATIKQTIESDHT